MLKITQIKVPKYTLVLQKNLLKRGLQITSNILTMNNTKNIALSKYIWSLKENQITSTTRWSIVKKVYGRTKISFYPLCLAEKFHLIEHFHGKRLFN